MLNKKEKELMKVLYREAVKNKNGVCLISPIDILNSIPYSCDFSHKDLSPSISALALDDYFDVIESSREGEAVYCVTLHPKGYGFMRELQSEQRAINFKIVLTVAGVVASFLLGKLLQAIFS